MFIFDLSGPQFLALYVFCLVGAWWFSKRIEQGLVNDHPTTQLSIYELAYLAGGADRPLSLALTRLAHHGHVVQGPDTLLATSTSPSLSSHRLERELFQQIASTPPVRSAKSHHTAFALQQIESSLATGGWVVDPHSPKTLRANRIAALPMWVLMALGLIKVGVGLMRDKPVLFLVLLLLITLVMGWHAGHISAQPVAAAKSHIESLTEQNGALYTTLSRNGEHLSVDDLSLAVALFGTSLLAGTQLSWVHPLSSDAVRSSSSGGGDGGGGDSSCGGGGGCGGCGGGGGGCS